jgi:DNA end-binding protein Ku
MKAIWKGSLSFGLVNIAVELNSAIQAHALGFTLLHAKCKTPIEYLRECPKCKKKVAWDEVVKGIETKKGSYFILTLESLKELKPKRTESIDIIEAIDLSAIDPIYYEHHYYVVPSKSKPMLKAYALFSKALEQLNKIAVGTFVMKDKEYVCAIRPYKNILLLSTLNYAYEIREIPAAAHVKAPALTKIELGLAVGLIKKLYKESFDIHKFKDTFAENLTKYLKAKAKGTKVVEKNKRVVKVKDDISLLHALHDSLEQPERIHRSGR